MTTSEVYILPRVNRHFFNRGFTGFTLDEEKIRLYHDKHHIDFKVFFMNKPLKIKKAEIIADNKIFAILPGASYFFLEPEKIQSFPQTFNHSEYLGEVLLCFQDRFVTLFTEKV